MPNKPPFKSVKRPQPRPAADPVVAAAREAARQARAEVRFFEENYLGWVEPWHEDKTRFKPVLVLEGASYKQPLLFAVPSCPLHPDEVPETHLARSGNGEFAYMNRVWPRGRGVPLYQNKKQGAVYWDQDIVIPVLMDGRSRAVWMALTPMEMMSQREGVSMAKQTVVIGGVGLGWLLRKICEKTTVERVIVVEQSQALLDWFGTRLCAEQPKVSEVICGDVYEQFGKFGPNARYVLDIWPEYGDAVVDPRFQAMKKEHPHVWGWGDYTLSEAAQQS